jgi:hypothetical protein
VSRMVRVIAMVSLLLTLISWGFGISAMLHPVSCPGAFIGCSEQTPPKDAWEIWVMTMAPR